MSRFSEMIAQYFTASIDASRLEEKRRQLEQEVDAWEKGHEKMHKSFSYGGIITYEQLDSYKVSTKEKPIGYPTGKNCITFRLPNIGSVILMYTVCVAPKGERGRFGLHGHDCIENNLQLEGNGECKGVICPPFTMVVFDPFEDHDYLLDPGASCLTAFKKAVSNGPEAAA